MRVMGGRGSGSIGRDFRRGKGVRLLFLRIGMSDFVGPSVHINAASSSCQRYILIYAEPPSDERIEERMLF